MDMVWDVLDTPFGWMGVLATRSRVLRRTTLPQETPEDCFSLLRPYMDSATRLPKRFTILTEQLIRYFNGDPVTFREMLIDVGEASPFFCAAWEACRSIPYGETRSYSWLAMQSGNPGASRAAGQSMAKNRLPIIIPCHRVISSNGRLGGFDKRSSGLDLKSRLLRLEQVG